MNCRIKATVLIKLRICALISHMKEETSTKLREKVIAVYDEIAQEFSQTRKHGWQEFKGFEKYIKDGDKIIDIGCGNGRFYEYISKKKKIKYMGIDNSENLINEAKKEKNAAFKKADMLEIPARDEEYDLAVLIASFHHIPGKKLRKEALREIIRVVKNKGTIIITVWNLFQPKYKKYIWQSYLKALLSFGKFDTRDTFIPWGNSKVKRYYYAFKNNELKKILENEGLKIIENKIGKNFTFICKK